MDPHEESTRAIFFSPKAVLPSAQRACTHALHYINSIMHACTRPTVNEIGVRRAQAHYMLWPICFTRQGSSVTLHCGFRMPNLSLVTGPQYGRPKGRLRKHSVGPVQGWNFRHKHISQECEMVWIGYHAPRGAEELKMERELTESKPGYWNLTLPYRPNNGLSAPRNTCGMATGSVSLRKIASSMCAIRICVCTSALVPTFAFSRGTSFAGVHCHQEAGRAGSDTIVLWSPAEGKQRIAAQWDRLLS